MENPHSVQDIASIRECQRGYTEGYIVELLKNVFLGVGLLVCWEGVLWSAAAKCR